MARRETAQQMAIMEYLAKGMKRQEIAAAVGCNVQTVDRVKADPALKEAYYKRCKGEIDDLVPLAIKRLKAILESETAQSSVQVAAIREVLDRSYLKDLMTVTQSDIKLRITYE